MIDVSRRKFLTGLLATPAIVTFDRLMPIKNIPVKKWISQFDIGIFYCPYVPAEFAEMTLDIETVIVTAKSRMLKATWAYETG